MKRASLAIACALVLGATSVRAERIAATLQYRVVGGEKMGQVELAPVSGRISAELQRLLASLVRVTEFNVMADRGEIAMKIKGSWADPGTAREAAAKVRGVAAQVEQTGPLPGTKVALTRVHIEVDEDANSGRAADLPSPEDIRAARERARIVPRLAVSGADGQGKLAEFTAVDVPLQVAMTALNKATGATYVLHVQEMGHPVYVQLRDVTADEVIAAIAESANLKVESRGRYVTFRPGEPPSRPPAAAENPARKQ